MILALALLVAQDSEVRSTVTRLGSIDPDERILAAADLARFSREDVRERAKGTPEGWLALAFLGDTSARFEAAKVLSDTRLAAAAAEVVARIGPENSTKELAKLLESEDPEVAFAAARALARSKSPAAAQALKALTEKTDRRKAVVGAYGLEFRKRGEYFRGYILAQVGQTDTLVREFAIVALVNLPHAPEEVRAEFDEKTLVRGAELKAVFAEKPLRNPVRHALGNFLVRAGVFSYGDVVGHLFHADAVVRLWAQRHPILRRSVFAAEVFSKYDEARAEIAEEHLRAFGAPRFEGPDEAKEWWKKAQLGILDADIVKAIDEGVAWLKSKQQPDGTWKYCQCGAKPYAAVDHTPGATALTVYTLLKCDVPAEDKHVQKGLDYLLALPFEKIPSAQTYTIALMAMCFSETVRLLKLDRRTKDSRAIGRLMGRLRECAEWLAEAQIRIKKGGYELGPWTYSKPAPRIETNDNSNTQFAMLGLLASQNLGVPVSPSVWQRALQWWTSTQMEDGGWPYVFQEEQRKAGTNSMSAAGVYCSLVAMASLRKKEPATLTGEEPVARGLDRFRKSYPIPAPARNLQFGHVFSVYYDLYSLERAMMISGTTTLAGKDWYHDGALFILWNQLATGEWLDVTDTCFALLFLKKAYIPVVTGEK